MPPGRALLPELAAVGVLGLVLLFQLLVPPIVGVANNGDFYQIAPQCGVYYLNGGGPEELDPNAPGYVSRLYRTGPTKNPQGFYSSGVLMMWVARALNDLVGPDERFDIRYLGAVHCCLYLGAVWLFVSAFPRQPLGGRLLAAALTLIVACETGYTAYFNSFYSESASLVFLVATVGMAMWSVRETSIGRALAGDLVFLVLSLLLVTAKPQNAVLAPALVALWWLLRIVTGTLRLRHRRAVGVLIAIAVTSVALGYVAVSPFREVNLYNHVFFTIVEDSDNVAELDGLGLPQRYGALAGTHWWSPLPGPEEDALRLSAARTLGYLDVLGFYVRQPRRFAELLSRGTRHLPVFRPPGVGNYPRERGGPPGELARRLSHLTWMKRAATPMKLEWAVAAFSLAVLLASMTVISPRQGAVTRGLAVVAVCLLAMAAMAFVGVLVAAGHFGVVNHLVLVHALVDLSAIILAVVAVRVWRHRFAPDRAGGVAPVRG